MHNGRPDGHNDVKGTTSHPTDPSERCFAKLVVLKFHEFDGLDHGYIYLSCGFGSWLHKLHAKPDPDDLCQHNNIGTPDYLINIFPVGHTYS
jgi:hypothetical protein